MVRLKGAVATTTGSTDNGFNSKMVRLKGLLVAKLKSRHTCFNSKMVRLKGWGRGLGAKLLTFQFQNGAIKRGSPV